MNPSSTEFESAIQEVILNYERLGAAARRRLHLNANEEHVLIHLAHDLTASPTELSRVAGLTTAGMTTLLDRLEAQGLLRREPHVIDRRRIMIVLTKEGLVACHEFNFVSAEVTRLIQGQHNLNQPEMLSFLHGAVEILKERIRVLEL